MTPSPPPAADTPRGANAVLTLSTIGFTLMFAVWLMFGILAIPIRDEFDLSEEQFGWLTAIAILNGAFWRLAFGVIADRYGGRRVFTLLTLATAVPAFMVSQASTYAELMIYAFLVGMAGNSFSVGISWNSAWFPAHRKGFALGLFGAGNVGASVTKFIGPALILAVPAAGLAGGLIPGGWRFVPFMYSILLVLMAAAMWFATPSQDRVPGRGRPIGEMLAPLSQVRVWRFSLYYVVVFGAYVALSVWLPRHYVDVFGLPLQTAALLTALFIFPASLLRPLGGWLSDRFGARRVMYLVFGTMTASLLLLSAPEGHIVIYAARPDDPDRTFEIMQFVMGPWLFTGLIFLVGVAMGVGKAAVYKYIPEYFPGDVGAVGGLVGMLGALGGFFLPPIFSYLWVGTGLPQSPFFVLFILSLVSFLWLHLVVLQILKEASPHLRHSFEHPPESQTP
jgi:MFS transporter, NNP family, nitrate/nitrite transporter